MSYNPLAQSATPQIFSAVDNVTGLPLAGGLLWTYASGTLTPLPTYTDNTLTTQNANPIILDNYGQAVIWLSDNNYRFNLLNASGIQQAHYPMDNIQPQTTTTFAAQLAATSGAGLVGFNAGTSYPAATVGNTLKALSGTNGASSLNYTAPFTGSVEQTQAFKDMQEVNLTDFGSVDTTGVTDCSSIFAAAIAAFGYSSYGYGMVINVPAGTIKANINISTGSITLRGKGINATQLIPASNNPVITLGNLTGPTQNIHIESMTIINTGSVAALSTVSAGSFVVGHPYVITSVGTTNFTSIGAYSNTVGLQFTASGVGSGTGTAQTGTPAILSIATTQINDLYAFRDLFIANFPVGFSILGRNIESEWTNVTCNSSLINGFSITPTLGGVVNQLRFLNCSTYVSGSSGFYIDGSYTSSTDIIGIDFDHCDFEGAGCVGNVSTPNSNPSTSGVFSKNVEGLTFGNQCYFENNGLGASDNLGTNIRMTGSYNMWFSIKSCLLWASQNAIYIDAQLSIGYIGESRVNGCTFYSLVTTGLNALSDIVVGPLYDTTTSAGHSIAIDAYGCTRVKFLTPGTVKTVNTVVSDGMDVSGLELLYGQNSGPATINTFINGELGQEISVFANGYPITFTYGGVSANGFFFSGQQNVTLRAYGVAKFVRVQYRGWLCISIDNAPLSVANGTKAVSITSLGPSALVGLTIAGWKQEYINATLSYIPYWQ